MKVLKPIKRLGQNFLQDPNTIRKIVGSLEAEADDLVVEIGPGTGALTRLLAERYRRFTAIELDERAVDHVRQILPDVHVIHGDVLKFDWTGYAREQNVERLSVIGNLPYYISSQILFSLLDAADALKEAVIMMQYEVAARLVAAPRTKEYGILSVAVQHACRPKLLFPVSRNVFFPRPDVRSAVIRLDFSKRPPDSGVDPLWLRKIIRTAFNQRRKTLRNSLSAIVEEAGKPLPEDVAPKRAEELSSEDFVQLALYLHDA